MHARDAAGAGATSGPLASPFTLDGEDGAIASADATEVGLAGHLDTRELARAWRVVETLAIGIVGINNGLISTEVALFGGIKQSGRGCESLRH